MSIRLAVLSAALFLSAAPAARAQGDFAQHPRLTWPGDPAAMTVVWRLVGTAPATLQWGRDSDCTLGSVQTVETDGLHLHVHTLDGLQPATRYHYRVIAGADTLGGDFFTLPPADAASLHFQIYGDTRTLPAEHDAVAASMLAAAAADSSYRTLIVSVGDLVDQGDLESYWQTEFFDTTYVHLRDLLAHLPYQACMGNHEQTGELFTAFFPYPYAARRYWSYDVGPAHFTIVDQYTSLSPASAQLAWLQADLAGSDAPWKFVVLHEPGWSAGPHTANALVRDVIQPLCEAHGVDVLFAGHNHNYARAEVGGVMHVTTGGGGAPLHDLTVSGPPLVAAESVFHSCRVSIDGDRLTLTAVATDGRVIDSFSLGRTVAAGDAPPAAATALRAYPNPFNPATTVDFELSRSTPVVLCVYDAAGRVVRTLAEGPLGPGLHRFRWDGRDDAGRNAASGVYLLRLRAGDRESRTRLVLAR